MGFQCQQFYLKDDRCAMKVSTDSLLFGGWLSIDRVKRAADFGCGCGILALMMAQRLPAEAHIDAIEYDHEAALQAEENIAASPWPQKISVHNGDVLQWRGAEHRYDLVLMNPPYFSKHLNSSNAKRQLARQGHGDVWQAWLQQALQLLAPAGRIAVVAPISAQVEIQQVAAGLGLSASRQCIVHSVAHKSAYLWLVELTRELAAEPVIENLVVRDKNKYTDAFLQYTGAFYLQGEG